MMLSCISRKIKIIQEFLSFETISWNRTNLINWCLLDNRILWLRLSQINGFSTSWMCHYALMRCGSGEGESKRDTWLFLQWNMETMEWENGPQIYSKMFFSVSQPNRVPRAPNLPWALPPQSSWGSLLLHPPYILGFDLHLSPLSDGIILYGIYRDACIYNKFLIGRTSFPRWMY